MKPIKINGKSWERLGVASTSDKCLQFAQEFKFYKEKPFLGENNEVHRASDGKAVGMFIFNHRGRWYLVYPAE